MLELQEQLTTTENQISFARQHYNATVLDYNTSIATIPNALIAGPLGFDKREFFDAEPEAEQVPDGRPRLRQGADDKPAPPPPPAPQQQAPPPPPPPSAPAAGTAPGAPAAAGTTPSAAAGAALRLPLSATG